MARSPEHFYNLAEQQLNLNSQVPSYWGNLGYWDKQCAANQNYADACQELAHQLAAHAKLNAEDAVLDIGFGCGDQLLLWLDQYQVSDLYGINVSSTQTQLSQQRLADAGYKKISSQLLTGSYEEMLNHRYPQLNTILALDCAYHFPNRQDFIEQSHQILPNEGKLALCDLTLSRPLRFKEQIILRAICRLCQIPYGNLLPTKEYLEQFADTGFTITQWTDITDQVFLPFGEWLNNYKQQYPEYRWTKYTATARFLAWAKRNNILSYIIVAAEK